MTKDEIKKEFKYIVVCDPLAYNGAQHFVASKEMVDELPCRCLFVDGSNDRREAVNSAILLNNSVTGVF